MVAKHPSAWVAAYAASQVFWLSGSKQPAFAAFPDLSAQWLPQRRLTPVNAMTATGYSDGIAPDSHRLPLAMPRAELVVHMRMVERSAVHCKRANPRSGADFASPVSPVDVKGC